MWPRWSPACPEVLETTAASVRGQSFPLRSNLGATLVPGLSGRARDEDESVRGPSLPVRNHLEATLVSGLSG